MRPYLFLVGIGIAVLAGLALFTAHPSTESTGPADSRCDLYRSHSKLRVALKPNGSFRCNGLIQEVPMYVVNTNAKGWREPPFPANKPNGTFRILALGDSFVFGQGVNQSERATEVLEHRLNAHPFAELDRAEVLNLGIPGTGMKDFYKVLRFEGLNYDPDMVLVFTTWADTISKARSTMFWKSISNRYPRLSASQMAQRVGKKKRDVLSDAAFNDSRLVQWGNRLINLVSRHDIPVVIYHYKDAWGRSTQLRRWARSQNATYVPPPPQFSNHPPDTYQLPDDHFNARGQYWMGTHLYRHLIAGPLSRYNPQGYQMLLNN